MVLNILNRKAEPVPNAMSVSILTAARLICEKALVKNLHPEIKTTGNERTSKTQFL